MAELTAGAVSSLLGVLKNEAQLLQRVGHDVTWMKQVRDLAHDCSNCIDYYLQRGDPAIYRAKRGIQGYFCWAAWLVEEYLAKRNAAVRLRELKERAGDVGKRRLRFDVEIPGKAAASPAAPAPSPAAWSSSSFLAPQAAAATIDEDVDDGDGAASATDSSSSPYYRHQDLEPLSLDNYFLERISSWAAEATKRKGESVMPCIGIEESGDASDIVSEGLAKAREQFRCTVRINLSSVHYTYDKLGPNRVLSYILRACKDNGQDYKELKVSRYGAWRDKQKVKREILKKIEDEIAELEKRIHDMEKQISSRRGGDNNKSTAGVTGGTGKDQTAAAPEEEAGIKKTDETGGVNASQETEAGLGNKAGEKGGDKT
ncbi:hypothetical protein U9M48_001891 [Paspalum notatum var. saurae]|uniref:Uncharacterized protein n=1 Tax=Paspalum notatum var. saurae TaxID=547442 RepID=A0AAQ3SJC6_PASNO